MRALTALLLALVAAASGCGGSHETAAATATVDPTTVESGIKQDLSTSAVQVTSVSCPDGVDKKKGSTFTCKVEMSNGATGKATVTQVGAAHYTYELKSGSVQVPGDTVDAAVEKSLAAQGIHNATVGCPANVVVEVGTTVTCAVSGSQGVASGTVTYTFSNENGTVDPSSVQTA